MTHTPGPWDFTNAVDIFSAINADRGDGEKAGEWAMWKIATTNVSNLPIEIRKANARLIAAAPELLEALKAVLAYEHHAKNEVSRVLNSLYGDKNDELYIELMGTCVDVFNSARQIIAKAEGK